MILLTSPFTRSYAGISTRIIQQRGEGMPRSDYSVGAPLLPGPAPDGGLARRPNTPAQYGH